VRGLQLQRNHRSPGVLRRHLLAGAGVSLLCTSELSRAGWAQSAPVTLLSAPLELIGDWDGSPPADAAAVISRMREVSLSGVRLLSDQQPEKLRVEEHSSGPPAIWLHADPRKTAWIIVDIGARAWCQLAYQFGHELGHVLCNSWGELAEPAPPCQWLEEAMVEAFSIRGLGLLASSWERNPPFPHDEHFARFIREYRSHLVEKYKKASWQASSNDIAAWFSSNRDAVEHTKGDAAVITLLTEEEADTACVEDLGAVNRWPGRSAVTLEEYLSLWQASCAEIGGSGRLPQRLRRLLRLS
jgi:hypothetical protein